MNRESKIRPTHSVILEAWHCAFANSPVTYLSGPITTGLLYVEAVRAGVITAEQQRMIMRANSESLIETARRLRLQRFDTIVEPASLNVDHWSQEDYLNLWEEFIEQHAMLILFVPNWEYSRGCATEFARAIMHDIRTETTSGSPITVEDGIALLTAAYEDLYSNDAGGALRHLADQIRAIVTRLRSFCLPAKSINEPIRKDASLDHLSSSGFNVAQFISFAPSPNGPIQQYARIFGCEPNAKFESIAGAVDELIKASPGGSVNIRSYEPFNPRSREFIYGVNDRSTAIAALLRLSDEGLHTIINETFDVHDGGVSGVLMGNVLEFSPDDTPRCVEKPGIASLPRGWGRELLATVYRFPIDLSVPLTSRLEFSLHPAPRGWQQTNILVWEYEESYSVAVPETVWPNNFSRLIGDKVFGLLVAHHIGLPVPYTTVINRRVAPFSFGRPTGWGETWIRTSPIEQEPGRYPTLRGWVDPFALLQNDDHVSPSIVSIISQEGVRPYYSGALIVCSDGEIIIEGKLGEGETFMQGESGPEALPSKVRSNVLELFNHAAAALGPVRLEWVHDGDRAWIVQLHRGATATNRTYINPGEAGTWVFFHASEGIEALRIKLESIRPGEGLVLKGQVGLTSHIADLIRKKNIPARMET